MKQFKKTPEIPSRYYSSFRPFEELFQTGLPILTYHKLGPRPRKVRIKGLYVDHSLFAWQLAELRQAGLISQSLRYLRHANHNRQPSFVVSFDDGFQNVLESALESLVAHQCHAIQFLVADLLGKTNEWERREGEVPERLMDTAQVREWLAAGHEIGSHSLTHPWLTRLPKAQAQEEISSSKKKLEDVFGVPIEHFCYPYGDWNELIRDLVQEAGYATACTTAFGVNTPGISPYELRRITARYPTLKWSSLIDGFRELLCRLRMRGYGSEPRA